MTAQIISVGTELLLGDILNTNAQFLSRELAALGISVLQQHTVGDNHGRLEELVEEAKRRSDILIFTGGLGYENRIPSIENISSVEVNYKGRYGDSDPMAVGPYISDDEGHTFTKRLATITLEQKENIEIQAF